MDTWHSLLGLFVHFPCPSCSPSLSIAKFLLTPSYGLAHLIENLNDNVIVFAVMNGLLRWPLSTVLALLIRLLDFRTYKGIWSPMCSTSYNSFILLSILILLTSPQVSLTITLLTNIFTLPYDYQE